MSEPARQLRDRFTWSDYRTWNGDQRWEIIGGEAFLMSPSPTARHQRIVGEMHWQMQNYFRGKPCRLFVSPMDVVLSEDDVVQPDLLVVCNEEQIRRTHIAGGPTLVVEVISDSSASRDRLLKMALYARSGVKEFWLVTPWPWMVEVYVLRGERYEVHGVLGKDHILVSPSFPDLKITLKDVFDYPLDPGEEPLVAREPPGKYVAAAKG
jgi:Uma2 family endonuclease